MKNEEKRLDKLARLWCAWNDGKLSGNLAMAEIFDLFFVEIQPFWGSYALSDESGRKMFLKGIVRET